MLLSNLSSSFDLYHFLQKRTALNTGKKASNFPKSETVETVYITCHWYVIFRFTFCKHYAFNLCVFIDSPSKQRFGRTWKIALYSLLIFYSQFIHVAPVLNRCQHYQHDAGRVTTLSKIMVLFARLLRLL